MVRRIVLIALVTVLLTAGCSPGDDTRNDAEGVDLRDVTLAAALTPFDSCDALLDHLRAEGLDRVGPYGLDGDGYYGVLGGDMAASEDSLATGGVVPETPPNAPVTTVPTSGTNTQEAFVDEPDGVKVADGRLYVVDDTTLRIIDVSGDEPVARGTLELPSWGQELLAVGDRVLAIGGPEEVYAIDDVAPSTWAPYGGGGSILTEIDVSDPDDPTVAHTLELDGGYLNARLVGETARVVVSAAHPAFPFVYPSDDSPQARAIAEAANRSVIEDATIDDWLPGATLDGDAVDAVDCATVQRPAEFSGFGFLSVLTVDMTQPLAVPPSTTVLADGQTVYASTDRLFVATTRPQEVIPQDDPGPLPTVPPVRSEDYETAVHQFDITGSGAATYVASGAVSGHLVDASSMSEQDGRLRMATTEGAPWESSERAASRVAVLETEGDALVEVGAVEGLGRTEQIYSVRFVGDTAYVVTFRQTDPLFVVDLSDPTAPSLQGELEIPGYSAYLHPLDDGHLLGIGQEADANGMITGLQASVFDVTDPAHPTRVDQVVLPGESSAAEWDRHAFLYWAPTDQAVLPVWTGSLVLSVGPDHVDEQGRIEVPSGQEVRRNVVVGDHLLTVGTDTLVTSDLATLAPIAELPL